MNREKFEEETNLVMIMRERAMIIDFCVVIGVIALAIIILK